MAEWSKWQDIWWIDDFADLYKWPGVYKIRLIDYQGQPVRIGRLLGVDTDGLLAIGESVNVARRIREFYRAYEGQSFRHYVAERMFLIRFKTAFGKKIFKDCKIQFTCMRLKDKAEVKKYEERFLKSYFKTFGELPPLNSDMPDKNVDWRNI